MIKTLPWTDAEEVVLTMAMRAHLEIMDTQDMLRDVAKVERSPIEIGDKMREMRRRKAA